MLELKLGPDQHTIMAFEPRFFFVAYKRDVPLSCVMNAIAWEIFLSDTLTLFPFNEPS